MLTSPCASHICSLLRWVMPVPGAWRLRSGRWFDGIGICFPAIWGIETAGGSRFLRLFLVFEHHFALCDMISAANVPDALLMRKTLALLSNLSVVMLLAAVQFPDHLLIVLRFDCWRKRSSVPLYLAPRLPAERQPL